MPEDTNNEMSALMQSIYEDNLDDDEKLIRGIVQIEYQAKLREYSTRARKDKIKSLLDGVGETDSKAKIESKSLVAFIFQKVAFENFRVYRGSHEIVFSTDSEKKLTLIHAENSTGKTTSLVGIKWCLFGDMSEFHRDDSEIINSHSGKDSCKVKLNFSLGEDEYQVVRSYSKSTHRTDLSGKLTLFKISNDGKHNPVPEPQAFINGLMPKELARYFLFAGEQFAEEVVARPKSHRRAFRDILGFSLAEAAIEDLKKITKDTEGKIRDIAKENKSTATAAKLLESINEEMEGFNVKIIQDKKAKDAWTEEFNKIQKIIDASDHNLVAELNNKLKGKERSLLGANKEHIEELIRKNKLISEYGYCIFGLEFSTDSVAFMDEQKKNQGLPSDFGQKFVNQLLESYTCCCGRSLEKGSEEYNRIENLIDTATTDTISNRVRRAENVGEHFQAKSKQFLDKLQTIENKIKSYEVSISSIEDTVKQTKDELSGLDVKGAEGIPDLIARRNEAQQKQSSLDYEIGRKDESLETLERQKKIQEKEMGLGLKNEELEKLQISNKYIDILIRKIEQELRKTELSTRNGLEENIQKNIDASMQKKWKVSINKDYKMEIRSTLGGHTIVGPQGGKGLLQLSSLALNAALISHSKKRSTNKNAILQPGIVAPLVIDAPFAQMGVGNQLDALEFLVKQSHQVILFLTTGQWRDQFEGIVKSHIGKRYIFVDHSSSCTDKISLNEKSYNLCEYDKELPPTEIKEIV